MSESEVLRSGGRMKLMTVGRGFVWHIYQDERRLQDARSPDSQSLVLRRTQPAPAAEAPAHARHRLVVPCRQRQRFGIKLEIQSVVATFTFMALLWDLAGLQEHTDPLVTSTMLLLSLLPPCGRCFFFFSLSNFAGENIPLPSSATSFCRRRQCTKAGTLAYNQMRLFR